MDPFCVFACDVAVCVVLLMIVDAALASKMSVSLSEKILIVLVPLRLPRLERDQY